MLIKTSFRNTIRVSNGTKPDHDQHSVGSDLGPNCLKKGYQQKNKSCVSKERVKVFSRRFNSFNLTLCMLGNSSNKCVDC